jgi:hypothetical protein
MKSHILLLLSLALIIADYHSGSYMHSTMSICVHNTKPNEMDTSTKNMLGLLHFLTVQINCVRTLLLPSWYFVFVRLIETLSRRSRCSMDSPSFLSCITCQVSHTDRTDGHWQDVIRTLAAGSCELLQGTMESRQME